MVRVKAFLVTGASSFALIGACAASAEAPQTAAAATPAPAATATSSSAPAPTNIKDIADIVVTANKREQKLNDVGVTVAVISGAALKEGHISSLADIALSVPGLSFANSANGTPIYTLRGVGFVESSLGAYPTVSTYLDEVPLPFPVLSTETAFDLERVEVLKGPQGTLFGENATGGAINFIAAKPTHETHAGLDVSYGRFNTKQVEGFVSGAFTDTLTARLAGRVEDGDGWQQSVSRPGSSNGKTQNYRGRFQLAWEASPDTKFLLNLNGWKDKDQTQAPQYIANVIQSPATPSAGLAQSNFAPHTPRAADWTPGVPFRDNRLLQASLRGDIRLTGDITLTTLTAYTDYKQRQGEDTDGVPVLSSDLPLDRGRIKTFFQEVRLSNGGAGRFRWIVGGNYEKSKVLQQIDARIIANSISTSLNAIGFTSFGPLQYTALQKYRNYAFYGNAEYDIIPTVTLKGGVRYTEARDRDSAFSTDPTLSPTGTGAFFYSALLGGAYGPYAGQPYAINNLPTAVNGVAPGAPGAYQGSLDQHNISYKVGVDWKPQPGVLVYANVSKGYKAGSFPTVSASVFSQYLPVVQESVQAYEAGVKLSPFGRLLQINAAGFYYDYRNKQLRSKTVDAIFGILDILQNIPKSSIKGGEAELTFRPARGLSIGATATYLDATIDQFSGINAGGVAQNFKGTKIPFTPKWQFGSNASYTAPISNRLDAFVSGSVNYRSKTTATIGGDINPAGVRPNTFAVYGIKAYALVDAQIGIKSRDGRWRASIWGKNITNTYYWNNVVAATDVIDRYTGMPATYGVSFGFSY
jgi:iron complex outermembrane receptor protein